MNTGAQAGRELAAALRDAPLPELPPRRPGSSGIVTAAGTPRQLLCAWLAVRRLRALGCDVPVEIFHAAGECVPERVAKAFPGDSRVRRLDDRSLAGFAIKPFAIWHASFDRCLWLDADNLALRNPEFLFALDAPALFWPDAFRTSDASFLGAFDASLPAGLEFESGQFLVGAVACREALWRACLLNGPLRDRAYAHVFGDKDTWRLAFAGARRDVVPVLPIVVGERALNVRVGLATVKVRSAAGRRRDLGLLQAGPDGAPLFFHRTVREWQYFDRQPTVDWVQRISAQIPDRREDFVPEAPQSPSGELLALERWALDAGAEAEWFLEACGVSPFRRRALIWAFRAERFVGSLAARIGAPRA